MDSNSITWRETCEILLRKISNDSLQMERRPSPELLHIHGQHDDLLGLGDPQYRFSGEYIWRSSII